MVDTDARSRILSAARAKRPLVGSPPATAFLILDTESVPDGRLIAQVRYPGDNLSPEEAIARAQAEARATSTNGSDFLPVTFQYPIAVCVLRVGTDFRLQALKCLDVPHFRPRELVRQFWVGAAHYHRAKLVSFNGRGFDLPLLELGAFRFGVPAAEHFQSTRNRYNGNHLDLMDWLGNYGAVRLNGGLDLLAKLLGRPGKMEISGDQIYRLAQEGRFQDINDYCLFDTLDTYFVFLRTRVLAGHLTLDQEQELVAEARAWLVSKEIETPGLRRYLAEWRDWEPWP